jgi:hypothetical protein
MKDADLRLVERVERLAKHRALTLEFADVELACRLAFVEEQRANEQEKRARHAEAERDAFSVRIGELEAEVDRLRSKDEPKKVTLGYRIRWYSAITKDTRWYTPSASAQIASGGTLFATKDEAHRCLRTLNCGWQKEAKIVRVVRWCKAERKDKP